MSDAPPHDRRSSASGTPRYEVSNEILAFQINTLQQAQIEQSALLREQIRAGFADTRQVLDKHTDQIAGIHLDQARMDGRVTAVEKFKQEQENRALEQSRQLLSDNRVNEVSTQKLNFYKWGAGLVVALGTFLTLLSTLGIIGGSS